MAPLVALMIWIGVHPTPFLERMEPSIEVVLERVEGAPRAAVETMEEATMVEAAVIPVEDLSDDPAVVLAPANVPARED